MPSGSAKIRAVTFDVGGTLIECWPSVGHVYAEVAARNGHTSLSADILNKNFKSAWRKFRNFKHTRADWSALVDTTFRGLVEPLPSKTFFLELYDRFSEPDAWRIFDDVVPALEILKTRGQKLGIVSNWDERLRPLLAKLKLDAYFKTVIVSIEVGARKPACPPFHLACAALGTLPAETLHVGDSLETDVEGARSAGLQARLLTREGPGRAAPGAIRSLRELDKI